MKITVNGEPTNIEQGSSQTTLDMVLKHLGHHPKLIVVEFNGVISNPKDWDKLKVEDGDLLEIVTIVGGG